MKHDWIFDVLQDLKDYALTNGLVRLATKVEEAQRIARDEMSVQARAAISDEPEGGAAH